MVTKLVLRPSSLSTIILCPNRIFKKPSRFKFHVLSLFSTNNPSVTLTVSESTSQPLAYGPSLLKGTKNIERNRFQSSILVSNPLQQEDEEVHDIIDEESFTRVYDVAAIRVPLEVCFELENRLRGHLLNWPRVRNIARVPGDEVDEKFLRLLGKKRSNADGGEGDAFMSLDRRMYGKAEGDGELLTPVLYREKLVKTFDSRGFVRFRNLAKMSRPDKKSKMKDVAEGGGKRQKGIGKNDFAVVEVVEDDVEGEDLSGLLGDEFKGRNWKGSTRLLLLDEGCASKGIEELPEAIKVSVPTL